MQKDRVHAFGRFELQVAQRRLLRQGVAVEIGDRAFDLLAALVEHRDRVVTKDELLDLVWRGVVVEESNVQVQVSTLRKFLGPDVIATVQGRGYRFTAPMHSAAPTSPAPHGAVQAPSDAAGNLPARLSPLVGRDDDLRALRELVEGHALVTVTGSGGMGKTVLALATADALRGRFRDGAWVVELTPLSDPALLAQTIASALHIKLVGDGSAQDQLVRALAPRNLLLLLDNCEHLIVAAAALVAALVAHAPAVHVLATSQEWLNVHHEHVFKLGPLSLPGPGEAPRAEVHGAVALLLQRAQAANPRVGHDADGTAAVADICRQLDGVPLAIELAAARVRVLGLAGLRDKLSERFKVLVRGTRNALPKHQTLRAAVDWSHDLLDLRERTLFRRLAAFVGSFDLYACEAVCGGHPLASMDIFELLARLVDKSLVIAEPDGKGAVRYRLLETLRRYGQEQLEAAGETRLFAHAHLQHFIALAEEAYAGRFEADAEWLDVLERELDNLRAALEWAAANEREAELTLAGALGWFWSLHTAHATEGQVRLRRALDGRAEATAAVARALTGAAMALTWAGAATEAAAFAQRSVAIWEMLGDECEAGLANEALGWARCTGGDTAGSLQPMERSVFLMRRVGDRRLMNRALVGYGQVLVALGDLAVAEPLAHEIIATGRELGVQRDIHYGLHFLGDIGLCRGDGVGAAAWYRQSLAAALAYGNVAEAAVEMEGLTMALAAQGRTELALRLSAAARAKMAAVGYSVDGVEFWGDFRTRYLVPARLTLGERAWRVEAEGRALAWEAAVGLAMADSALVRAAER